MEDGIRDNDYLYHYTNEEGWLGIDKSKMIYHSVDTEHDAVYGKGVYLTDFTPENDKYDILVNNYGNPPDKDDDRADFYIQIPKAGIDAKQFTTHDGRVIFVTEPFNKHLDLGKIRGVKFGEHEKYNMRPIGQTNAIPSNNKPTASLLHRDAKRGLVIAVIFLVIILLIVSISYGLKHSRANSSTDDVQDWAGNTRPDFHAPFSLGFACLGNKPYF